jgi:hypothetical protein
MYTARTLRLGPVGLIQHGTAVTGSDAFDCCMKVASANKHTSEPDWPGITATHRSGATTRAIGLAVGVAAWAIYICLRARRGIHPLLVLFWLVGCSALRMYVLSLLSQISMLSPNGFPDFKTGWR